MSDDRFVFFECVLGINRAIDILNHEFSEYHIVPGTFQWESGNNYINCILEKDQIIKATLPIGGI